MERRCRGGESFRVVSSSGGISFLELVSFWVWVVVKRFILVFFNGFVKVRELEGVVSDFRIGFYKFS